MYHFSTRHFSFFQTPILLQRRFQYKFLLVSRKFCQILKCSLCKLGKKPQTFERRFLKLRSLKLFISSPWFSGCFFFFFSICLSPQPDGPENCIYLCNKKITLKQYVLRESSMIASCLLFFTDRFIVLTGFCFKGWKRNLLIRLTYLFLLTFSLRVFSEKPEMPTAI